MATSRVTARIGVDADVAWAAISDAEAIAEWFPNMAAAAVEGDVRTITLGSGLPITEDIVTNDADLRRFQYRITGPLPTEYHLATVDIFDLGPGDCLLVYSTEIVPEAMSYVLSGAIDAAVTNLKTRLEAGDRFGS
ncbi:MAG TPA: SRPBCC family protein [Acidimicrobiales bacterium]